MSDVRQRSIDFSFAFRGVFSKTNKIFPSCVEFATSHSVPRRLRCKVRPDEKGDGPYPLKKEWKPPTQILAMARTTPAESKIPAPQHMHT